MKYKFIIVALLSMQVAISISKPEYFNSLKELEKALLDSKVPYNTLVQLAEKVSGIVDSKSLRRQQVKQQVRDAQVDILEKLSTKKVVEEPLISFVIPVYNRETVVAETIDSIYAQNIQVPFEVIVVDDASIDKSVSILKKYEFQNDNFFLYQNKQNRKSPFTRNVGMAHARGELIFNLDSDDVLQPGSFNRLFEHYQGSGCETAMFSQSWYVKDFSKKIFAREKFICPNNIHYAWQPLHEVVILISINNRIITKKSWLRVGGYIDMRGHDGLSFGLSQVATGVSYAVLPDSGYWHRTWSNMTKSMYLCDSVAGCMDTCLVKIVQDYEEILDKKTRSQIKQYSEQLKNHKVKDGNFSTLFLRGKKLNFVAKPFLEKYYFALRAEEDGEWKKALDLYVELIKPLDSKNIDIKAMEMAVKAGERKQALSILMPCIRKYL